MNELDILASEIEGVKPVPDSQATWLSRHRPSVAFACCIGAGPWRLPRRQRVQQSFIDALGDYDISEAIALRRLTKRVQLDWQRVWFERVNKVCRRNRVKFDSLFDAPFKIERSLKFHNFEAVFGLDVEHSPKVVALFARDYLFLPCFPVDRHVRKWFEDRKLPSRPADIMGMFRGLGISNPSGYSRAIFNAKAQNPHFAPTRRLA